MSVKELTWIGNISYAQPQGKGEYPGAVCMTFDSVKSFNDYFKPGAKGESLLVIDVNYIKSWFTTKVVAMVTNQLSEDELNEMQEVSREIEFAMMERRKKRTEEKARLEKVKKEIEAEEKRLATVGRKYEERVKHMRALDPSSTERKEIEAKLNAGDKDILGGG